MLGSYPGDVVRVQRAQPKFNMLAWLNGRAADLSIELNENIIMELDSKKKGNLTEMQCMSAFMAQNCGVCIPFGDNSKYDFIADIDGHLYKIQVKTASVTKQDPNAIRFSCRSTHLNCKGVQNVRYTKEDIDYFATYFDNQCYLVPIAECSVEKVLRFSPPRSGQQKGITYAAEYALEKQLTHIRGEVVEH